MKLKKAREGLLKKIKDYQKNGQLILAISFIIYIIGFTTWVILREITGDRYLFVLVINFMGVWVFTPLLVYIPWVVLRSNKLHALLLSVPVVLFFNFFGPLVLPKSAVENPVQVPVSVLTFNIRGTDFSYHSVLDLLDAYPTDVLAFQEVSRGSYKYFTEALVERYPYQVFDAEGHLAIFSRYPIVQPFEDSNPLPSIQSILLEVDGIKVNLINAHLARTGILNFFLTGDLGPIQEQAIERTQQVRQIKSEIHRNGFPAIVACDCNMTDLTYSYMVMKTGIQDAYRRQGWGFGHTFLVPRGFDIHSYINLPFQRIDYLFNTADISILGVELINFDTGSDHLPLWALFELATTRVMD